MGTCQGDPTSRVEVCEKTAPETLTHELGKGGAWLEVGAELCQAGVVEHFLLPQAALAALPTLA